MGNTYDYLVGRLKCMKCEAISPLDSSTNMQTCLRSDPQLAQLGEGDELLFEAGEVTERGYFAARNPGSSEAVCFLDIWECPSCGAPFNWARTSVKDHRIVGVEAVDFDRSAFESAHYISHECISVAHELSGKPFTELVRQDVIGIIRELL